MTCSVDRRVSDRSTGIRATRIFDVPTSLRGRLLSMAIKSLQPNGFSLRHSSSNAPWLEVSGTVI